MPFLPATEIDPAGRYALVPEPGSDSIRISQIDARTRRFIAHGTAGLRRGAGPIQLLFHPDLPVIYVANAGNSTIAACHWDAATGHAAFAQAIRTVPLSHSDTNTLMGIAIGPGGRYLYAANRGHDSIALFALQRGKGKMFLRMREMLPCAPSGPPVIEEMGTRMTLPASATALQFAVQPANGMLSRVENDASAGTSAGIVQTRAVVPGRACD